MKHSIIGSASVLLVVGPLSVYLWQPRRNWSFGRMDCPEWCCRWNAYLGPFGIEWALPTEIADRIIDEAYEQAAQELFDESAPVAPGVRLQPYDVDY
jgi:hypothetical protein